MNQNVLQRVIDTEREIEQAIESEKKKISAWLTPIIADCEAVLTEEDERLRRDFQAAVAKGRQQAAENAARQQASCREQAAALENISDQQLQEIIIKHLAVILPHSSS